MSFALRARLTVLILSLGLLFAAGWSARSATYQVALQTPKLQSVSASLSLTGGITQVQVDVSYDATGAAKCAAILDGTPTVCSGQIGAKRGRATYHFNIRDQTNSGAVVTLTGSSTSSTARVSYTGPKGRLRGAQLPVTMSVDSTMMASVEISPAIDYCRTQLAIDVSGPYSPDTIFLRGYRGEFDAVIACYHDQATIAVKSLSFGSAVNVTLGLPLIRTSVDHGTAVDIAGKNIADASSMTAAVKLAAELAGMRQAAKHS